jgi:hypothetical protein
MSHRDSKTKNSYTSYTHKNDKVNLIQKIEWILSKEPKSRWRQKSRH